MPPDAAWPAHWSGYDLVMGRDTFLMPGGHSGKVWGLHDSRMPSGSVVTPPLTKVTLFFLYFNVSYV